MKKFLLFALVFIVGGVTLPLILQTAKYIAKEKRIAIQAPDGTKHVVPDEVMASKDCDAFRKWRDGLMKPGFMPMVHPCPWQTQEGELGTYIVNGVTFNIPKNAFLSHHDEGENSSLHLLLQWPDLTPASWSGDQSQVIKVGIYPNHDYTGKIEGLEGILDKEDYIYNTRANWREMTGAGQYRVTDPEPVELFRFKGGEYGLYKLPRLGHINTVGKDFYVWGNPLDPDHWYMCNTNNPVIRCETEERLNKKISLSIKHHREYFIEEKRFKEVPNRIKEKISSYIQN